MLWELKRSPLYLKDHPGQVAMVNTSSFMAQVTQRFSLGPDAHLHTLQLLSAHVKLLLDAPEHLWRLLERNKYFPAAWLFLLARVVHRALVRVDDDQEETSWIRQGVDIMVHALRPLPFLL